MNEQTKKTILDVCVTIGVIVSFIYGLVLCNYVMQYQLDKIINQTSQSCDGNPSIGYCKIQHDDFIEIKYCDTEINTPWNSNKTADIICKPLVVLSSAG